MSVIKMPLFIGDNTYISFEDANGNWFRASLEDANSISLEIQGIDASSGDAYAHHKILDFVKGSVKISTILDNDMLAELSALEARNRSDTGLLKITPKLIAYLNVCGKTARELRSELLRPIISYPVIAAENAASLSKSSIPPLSEIINREMLNPTKFDSWNDSIVIILHDVFISNVRLTGNDHASAEANPVEFDVHFQNMKINQPATRYWWWEKEDPQE